MPNEWSEFVTKPMWIQWGHRWQSYLLRALIALVVLLYELIACELEIFKFCFQSYSCLGILMVKVSPCTFITIQYLHNNQWLSFAFLMHHENGFEPISTCTPKLQHALSVWERSVFEALSDVRKKNCTVSRRKIKCNLLVWSSLEKIRLRYELVRKRVKRL